MKEWRFIEDTLEREVFKLRIGDELQPGILKLAKVDIANKRKIKVAHKVCLIKIILSSYIYI